MVEEYVAPGRRARVEFLEQFGADTVPVFSDFRIEETVDGSQLVGETGRDRLAFGMGEVFFEFGIEREGPEVRAEFGALGTGARVDFALVMTATTTFDDRTAEIFRRHL